jgi:hypothetical protein
MSYASYERQMLATYAAGYINGAGTTIVTYGCSLKRTATGVVEVTFGASDGLVNDESWTSVQVKGASNAAAYAIVEDTSNVKKTVFVFRGTEPVDADLEIELRRSVTKFAG